MGGTNRRGRGMAVVVRCAACSGLARVGPEAVGLLVVCPRCHEPFLAEPVAAPAPPPPLPVPPPDPDPPPGFRHRPDRPPRPERPERPDRPPRPRRPRAAVAEEPHDIPPPAAGGVPFSVIIGLALLPLAIPLLWLLGREVLDAQPAFTLATPASLAAAAAALCLAVAYTVDWSAATRIKGVLTLVGLAYLTGFGLYFLKKTTVEWVEQQLGRGQRLEEVRGDGYEVVLPGPVGPARGEPLAGLTGHKGTAQRFRRGGVVCVAAAGPDPDPDPRTPDADWFDARRAAVVAEAGGVLVGETVVAHRDQYPGREWVVKLRAEGVRIVRVYRADGRVYALSAEGRNIAPDDDDVDGLFRSFAVTARK